MAYQAWYSHSAVDVVRKGYERYGNIFTHNHRFIIMHSLCYLDFIAEVHHAQLSRDLNVAGFAIVSMTFQSIKFVVANHDRCIR